MLFLCSYFYALLYQRLPFFIFGEEDFKINTFITVMNKFYCLLLTTSDIFLMSDELILNCYSFVLHISIMCMSGLSKSKLMSLALNIVPTSNISSFRF